MDRGSRMLSEHLQDRVGRNETSKPRVPHGAEVFASRFLKLNGERVVIEPRRFAIGSEARCECFGVRGRPGPHLKRQIPHGHHRSVLTLLLPNWAGWPVPARSSWRLLVQ